MLVEPVVLEGRLVRLEPLGLDHLEALCEAGLGTGAFRWFTDPIKTPEQMRRHVEWAVAATHDGSQICFATVDQGTGRAVGSTHYLNIERAHHRLEIGYTWLSPTVHGRGYNSEAKLLQMEHAFERLAANRVEWKTDALNERSRGALLGIGATFEGIFRNHIIVADGRLRHSAYYSVIREEWPEVKERLEARLARQAQGAGVRAQRTSTMR
ncbi:MAG: GNAT family N-acetyltransferase [Chloroflexi bacterium]|nr:GNAT family N-acetyltransferase [Chloroflexota bacterium]